MNNNLSQLEATRAQITKRSNDLYSNLSRADMDATNLVFRLNGNKIAIFIAKIKLFFSKLTGK